MLCLVVAPDDQDWRLPGRQSAAAVDVVFGDSGLTDCVGVPLLAFVDSIAVVGFLLAAGGAVANVLDDLADEGLQGGGAVVAVFAGADAEGAEAGDDLMKALPVAVLRAGIEDVGASGAADGVFVGVHLEKIGAVVAALLLRGLVVG